MLRWPSLQCYWSARVWCVGLTNTVTAVKNAQMAESPVLLIGGAAATLLKGRGALQDIDQLVLFKPLCKFCATVQHLRDIKSTLTHAIHMAQSGTPGTTNTAIHCHTVNCTLQLCSQGIASSNPSVCQMHELSQNEKTFAHIFISYQR